jgi:hypothetical protein
MSDENVIVGARNFLLLLGAESVAATKPLAALADALDRLAYAHSGVADKDLTPSGAAEAPAADYDRWRAAAQDVFPNISLYACVTPEVDATEVTLADAYDDIADIACELQAVIWYWQNTTVIDAVWCFRFGYQSHWGRHLMNLRSYLHRRLFET